MYRLNIFPISSNSYTILILLVIREMLKNGFFNFFIHMHPIPLFVGASDIGQASLRCQFVWSPTILRDRRTDRSKDLVPAGLPPPHIVPPHLAGRNWHNPRIWRFRSTNDIKLNVIKLMTQSLMPLSYAITSRIAFHHRCLWATRS